MSGQIPEGSEYPTSYLQNVPGLSFQDCRVAFAYAAQRIRNGYGDTLPMIKRTEVPLHRIIGNVRGNSCGIEMSWDIADYTYNDPDFQGLTPEEMTHYAAMCNQLSHDVIVFPPVVYIAIAEGFYLENRGLAGLLHFWAPSVDTENRVFPYKYRRPRNIVFFATSHDAEHGMIFVGRRDDRRGAKDQEAVEGPPKRRYSIRYEGQVDALKAYYKGQYIDSALGYNLKETTRRGSKVHTYKLTNAPAGWFSRQLNKALADYAVKWTFDKDSVNNFYLRKNRQGLGIDCALYTCLHARFFCEDLPLFCGKYNIVDAGTCIIWELHKGMLIDFRRLVDEVSLRTAINYLRYTHYEFLPRFDRAEWAAVHNIGDFRLYKRPPPGQENDKGVRFIHLYRDLPDMQDKEAQAYIPYEGVDDDAQVDILQEGEFNQDAAGIGYGKALAYSEQVKRYGRGRVQRPDYGPVGCQWDEIPGDIVIPIPHGMNPPASVRFVYNNRDNDTNTVVSFNYHHDQ